MPDPTASEQMMSRINTNISQASVRNRNWRRYAIFFDVATPVLAFCGAITALFGESTKLFTAGIAAVVTLLSTLRSTQTPQVKAAAANSKKERFTSLKIEVHSGLDMLERQYRGQTQLDAERIRYFESKRAALDDLIKEFTPSTGEKR